MKLKCVVVDDEPLARDGIAAHVNKTAFLELTGTGGNPIELAAIMKETEVDLIFLDIQMPVLSGIEFLKLQTKLPMVIITTAYTAYALEGYQLDVLDYLVKPITYDRFLKAATKARDYHQLVQSSGVATGQEGFSSEYFFIKTDYRYERIFFNEILFIEAVQNYVVIYTTKAKYMTLLYLKNFEEKLDPRLFMRIQKSYIVSLTKIDGIENNEVIIGAHRVPVSRNYRDELMSRVVTDKLWKK